MGFPLRFITKQFNSQTKQFSRNVRKWVFPKLHKYPIKFHTN